MGVNRSNKREVFLGVILLLVILAIGSISYLIPEDFGGPLDQEITGAAVISPTTSSEGGELNENFESGIKIETLSNSLISKLLNIFSFKQTNSLTGAAVSESLNSGVIETGVVDQEVVEEEIIEDNQDIIDTIESEPSIEIEGGEIEELNVLGSGSEGELQVLGAETYCGGTVACACGNYLNESRIFDLNDNLINCAVNGLTINISNLELDCAGFPIRSSFNTNTGITIFSTENISINNCDVGGYNFGLNLSNVDTVYLEYNNISVNNNRGVFLEGNNNNLSIQENIIHSNGQHGIFLITYGAVGIQVINNTIYNNTGVGLSYTGINGTVQNNILFNNSAAGLVIDTSSNASTVSYNLIYDNGGAGINSKESEEVNFFENNLTNNTFILDTITDSFVSSGSVNNSFIFLTGATNNVEIKNVSVIHSNALVIDDESGNGMWNNLIYTNEFGLINISSNNLTIYDQLIISNPIILEENNVGIDINSNNLNLNKSAKIEFYQLNYAQTPELHKEGVRCDDTAFCNISYDIGEGILLANVSSFSNYTNVQSNTAPTHSTPILNSSLETNLTSENLTAWNISTTDLDGDLIKNIYNWKVNGGPFVVLNMPFEGINGTTSNNAWDYSGNEYSAIENNGVLWNSTGGYDGKGAYEFDGVNDYIELSGLNVLEQLNNSFTLAAWVKHNDYTSSWSWAFSSTQDGTHYFELGKKSGNGELRIHVHDLTPAPFVIDTNGANIADGNWHHIAATYNSSDMSLYVDGLLNVTAPAGGPMSFNYGNLVLGSNPIGERWNGTIDEVLVLNKSLSEEQLLALYNNQTNLIVSHETTVGDNWTVEITPNDGDENGITKESNQLIVLEDSICSTLSDNITLTEDIYTGSPCFIVNANDIVIDGNGYGIFGTEAIGGKGIDVGNFNNVIIKNLDGLTNFSLGIDIGSSSTGVEIQNVTINSTNSLNAIQVQGDNVIINSSTIDCNCSLSIGAMATIHLMDTASFGQIINNNIFSYSDNPVVFLGNGQNHNVSGNQIYSELEDGLSLGPSSSGALISWNNVSAENYAINGGGTANYSNNNFTSLISESSSSVLVYGSENIFEDNSFSSDSYALEVGTSSAISAHNYYSNNYFESTGDSAVIFNNATNNTFFNDIFVKGGATDIIKGESFDIIFTNVSLDKYNISLGSNYNSSILFRWYLGLNVSNSSNDPVSSATINISNSSNIQMFEGTNGINGLIDSIILNEGVLNATGWYYETPHTISGNKTGFDDAFTSINMTIFNSTSIVLTMNQTIAEESICGALNDDYTFTQNISSNGTCFSIEVSDIIVDFAGFFLEGNSTENAFVIGNASNVTIKDGSILNFNETFFVRNFSLLNITNITILNASNSGFMLDNVNNSVIERVEMQSMPLGLNSSLTYNNSFYNNIFNATVQNVIDNGNNSYNTSYSCSDSYTSIIGRNCSGGNYWNNYQGIDDGSASSPNNVANDSIGDTSLPYVNNYLISVPPRGDFLPLLYCSESWKCGAWSACSGGTQTRSCGDTNSCGTILARPVRSRSCSPGGGGGSSSSSGGGGLPPLSNPEGNSNLNANGQKKNPTKIIPKFRPPIQTVGPINAIIPAKEYLLSLDEVKQKLVFSEMKHKVVDPKVGSKDSGSSGSSSTSGGSSSGQDSGGSSQGTSSSGAGEKKVAVIDNAYDARRTADLPREIITIDLSNTGNKAMVLVPFAKQEFEEDLKPVVIRKIYPGSTGENSGLKISSMGVSNEMLKASLGAIDHIVIEAGKTETIEMEVSAGVGSSSSQTVVVSMHSSDGETISDEALITQVIELERTVTTVSSVVPNEGDNSIDIFAVIARTDTPQGVANDAAISQNLFGIYGGQYLEISLLDVSKLSRPSFGGKFGFASNALFASDSNTLFTDVYGPYDINSKLEGLDGNKEGFVFAQRFNYDPTLLTSGQYMFDVHIYDGVGTISKQSFLLDLDPNSDLQDTVLSSLVGIGGSPSATSPALTGALVGDVTGAVSFSEIATVAYEQTEEAAYIIYEDTISTRESQIAFAFLLILVGFCLLVFVFGPVRPALFDMFKGATEEIQTIRKDLNA